jgi:superfamily II RNA helicase
MSLQKSNGNQLIKVPPTSVLQIAGRAGRAHSIYDSGEVTW